MSWFKGRWHPWVAFLETRGACYAESPVWQALSITDMLDISGVMTTADGARQLFNFAKHLDSPNGYNPGKPVTEPRPFNAYVQDPELGAESLGGSQRHKTCIDCE